MIFNLSDIMVFFVSLQDLEWMFVLVIMCLGVFFINYLCYFVDLFRECCLGDFNVLLVVVFVYYGFWQYFNINQSVDCFVMGGVQCVVQFVQGCDVSGFVVVVGGDGGEVYWYQVVLQLVGFWLMVVEFGVEVVYFVFYLQVVDVVVGYVVEQYDVDFCLFLQGGDQFRVQYYE